MSKAQILAELPKLNVDELREIQNRILQLEEEEVLNGRAQPTDEEKALLDREFEDYSSSRNAGSDWKEVQSRLKQ